MRKYWEPTGLGYDLAIVSSEHEAGLSEGGEGQRVLGPVVLTPVHRLAGPGPEVWRLNSLDVEDTLSRIILFLRWNGFTTKIYSKNSYHKIEPTGPPLDTAQIGPFVVCLRAIFCTWRADNKKSWQTRKNMERPLLNKNADLSRVIGDAFQLRAAS